jgi:hypothetical protein
LVVAVDVEVTGTSQQKGFNSMSPRFVGFASRLLIVAQTVLVFLACLAILEPASRTPALLRWIGGLMLVICTEGIWRTWQAGLFFLTPSQLRGKVGFNVLQSISVLMAVIALVVVGVA